MNVIRNKTESSYVDVDNVHAGPLAFLLDEWPSQVSVDGVTRNSVAETMEYGNDNEFLRVVADTTDFVCKQAIQIDYDFKHGLVSSGDNRLSYTDLDDTWPPGSNIYVECLEKLRSDETTQMADYLYNSMWLKRFLIMLMTERDIFTLMADYLGFVQYSCAAAPFNVQVVDTAVSAGRKKNARTWAYEQDRHKLAYSHFDAQQCLEYILTNVDNDKRLYNYFKENELAERVLHNGTKLKLYNSAPSVLYDVVNDKAMVECLRTSCIRRKLAILRAVYGKVFNGDNQISVLEYVNRQHSANSSYKYTIDNILSKIIESHNGVPLELIPVATNAWPFTNDQIDHVTWCVDNLPNPYDIVLSIDDSSFLYPLKQFPDGVKMRIDNVEYATIAHAVTVLSVARYLNQDAQWLVAANELFPQMHQSYGAIKRTLDRVITEHRYYINTRARQTKLTSNLWYVAECVVVLQTNKGRMRESDAIRVQEVASTFDGGEWRQLSTYLSVEPNGFVDRSPLSRLTLSLLCDCIAGMAYYVFKSVNVPSVAAVYNTFMDGAFLPQDHTPTGVCFKSNDDVMFAETLTGPNSNMAIKWKVDRETAAFVLYLATSIVLKGRYVKSSADFVAAVHSFCADRARYDAVYSPNVVDNKVIARRALIRIAIRVAMLNGGFDNSMTLEKSLNLASVLLHWYPTLVTPDEEIIGTDEYPPQVPRRFSPQEFRDWRKSTVMSFKSKQHIVNEVVQRLLEKNVVPVRNIILWGGPTYDKFDNIGIPLNLYNYETCVAL